MSAYDAVLEEFRDDPEEWEGWDFDTRTDADIEEAAAVAVAGLPTTRCAACFRPMLLDLVNNPHSLCADHREEG